MVSLVALLWVGSVLVAYFLGGAVRLARFMASNNRLWMKNTKSTSKCQSCGVDLSKDQCTNAVVSWAIAKQPSWFDLLLEKLETEKH